MVLYIIIAFVFASTQTGGCTFIVMNKIVPSVLRTIAIKSTAEIVVVDNLSGTPYKYWVHSVTLDKPCVFPTSLVPLRTSVWFRHIFIVYIPCLFTIVCLGTKFRSIYLSFPGLWCFLRVFSVGHIRFTHFNSQSLIYIVSLKLVECIFFWTFQHFVENILDNMKGYISLCKGAQGAEGSANIGSCC